MAERGQHQITRMGTKVGLPAYVLLGLLVVVFGAAIVSTAWDAGRTAWMLSRPIPPTVHTADFASAGGKSDIELVLGEGHYEIVYETATVSTDIPRVGSPGVFFADFANGRYVGDAVGASVYVLFGPIKLTVSELREQDNFLAGFVTEDMKLNAHFSFRRSGHDSASTADQTARNSPVRKKIIILGKLEEVHFPAGYGDSKQNITILDLAPSDRYDDMPWMHSASNQNTTEEPSDETRTSPTTRPHVVPEHYRPSAPHVH